MHVGQLESDQRIFLLEIWQYLTKKKKNEGDGVRTGSKVSAPPTAQKENPVWNIPTLCTASECAHYYSPLLSVASSSSPPPTLCSPSFFSYFSLSPLPSHSPSLPPPLFCSAKRLPLCSEDETESVGLIIPDQSFASTSLPALLGSSWSAVPSEITSHRGTHSWILILINSNATFGLVQIHKMSVWWGQRGSVPPVIGVNCMHIDTNLYQRTFHLCRFVPVIVALIAIALVVRSSFLLLWQNHSLTPRGFFLRSDVEVAKFKVTYAQLGYNLQSVHFSIPTCICTCVFVFLVPLNCILCREEKVSRKWCH